MDPRFPNPPYMGTPGRMTRPATEADFAPDVARAREANDKGFLAQIVDQQRQILGDLSDLTHRIANVNDRLMGQEGKEVGSAAEGVRPPAELDAAASTLMELQTAIGRLHYEVVRLERL